MVPVNPRLMRENIKEAVHNYHAYTYTKTRKQTFGSVKFFENSCLEHVLRK
jgi:hypothetical protein